MRSPDKLSKLRPMVQDALSKLDSSKRTRYLPLLFSMGDFEMWTEWLEAAKSASLWERKQMAAAMAGLKSTDDLSCDFIRKWHIAGPFDNANDAGFDRIYGPERKSALSARYDDALIAECRWRSVETNASGFLNFLDNFQQEVDAVAYAQVEITAERSVSVPILLGSDDAAAVWLNGKEIHREHRHRGARPAQDLIIADFKRGPNRILVKVDQVGGDWGLYLQVLDRGKVLHY